MQILVASIATRFGSCSDAEGWYTQYLLGALQLLNILLFLICNTSVR